MNILVTGAKGMVGTALVNNLKNHAFSQISRAVKKDPSLKLEILK